MIRKAELSDTEGNQTTVELRRLLSRLWRWSLLGVGGSLALIPFVDRPDLPAGFALGWSSGIIASWLLYLRLSRLEGQPAEKAVRSIQISSVARFSLSVLALFIAYKTPGVFDLLSTGVGLVMNPVISTITGWIEAKYPSYWEKQNGKG